MLAEGYKPKVSSLLYLGADEAGSQSWRLPPHFNETGMEGKISDPLQIPFHVYNTSLPTVVPPLDLKPTGAWTKRLMGFT